MRKSKLPSKDVATSGATIRRHLFLGVAVRCRIGLDKAISVLVVARSFRVLRSEWCQKWCQTVSTSGRRATTRTGDPDPSRILSGNATNRLKGGNLSRFLRFSTI
jgi:hypothetical protein